MAVMDRSLPPQGFVIAVRAIVVSRSAGSHEEWLIASRWGHGGSYLSIARTLVRADATAIAPMHLAPRWSAFALLDTSSTGSAGPSFTFTAQPPVGVRLAGR